MEWFEETLHDNWRQRLRVKEILYRDKTELQDLILFESWQWGRCLALDGVLQTTTADECAYHEMLVHVPLLGHGAARDVLVIGGGDGGCLREILKHDGVRQASLVEIDRGVIDFCARYLPEISDGAFDSPKVRVIVDDGARFMRESEERFDVILIDSTDPIGPGQVLFTEAFYRDCRARLASGGILATQSGNPGVDPRVLANGQARLRSAGFKDVSFYLTSVPTYVGGDMTLGWASDDPDNRLVPADEVRRRGWPSGLRYYQPALQTGAFAQPAWMRALAGMDD